MNSRLLLMALMLSSAVISANARHLPQELTFPPVAVSEDSTAVAGDSIDANVSEGDNTVEFSVDQTLFDKSFTSVNNFLYSHDFGAASVSQGLWYEQRIDKLQNARHYLNATGSLQYPLTKYDWIIPGFDWTPTVQYSNDRSGQNALSTIDIGPNAALDIMGIPLNLRAGMSGRRIDSLFNSSRGGGYRGSVGAYGAFGAGSWEEPLPFAPIYFIADGVGRQIERSSMASLTSSLLSALRVGEKDSLFIYGDASLFNGREGYLEGSADSRVAQFVETPWRVERDVTAIVGYKAARRFVFFPSVYYGVTENSLSFLNDARKRDERTVGQTLSGAISTDSTAGLYYDGTLSFEWRHNDKLFGKKLPQTIAENIDSLDVNLWDNFAFDPRTAHKLALKLPWSMRLKYEFGLTRYLTEYPNFYINRRDTVANKDDSDRRTQQQRLALEYKDDGAIRAEVFGELIDYDLVFLKQAKSSSNRTDNTQRVGLSLEWSPDSKLLITESVLAEAKRGTFHFPAFHQKALQRPRYSRSIGSALSTDWQITELIGVSGKWNIKVSDYGFWYGKEYMEEILAASPAARTNYYAITSKSVYYTIDVAVRVTQGELMFEAGNAVTAARDRNYESGNYIMTNEHGYTVKPYISAAWPIGAVVEASAQLSRTFAIGNDALGYWDFRLQAEGGF